ncbi:hypothetical protein HNQ59_000949 [Chitinivorax tropicus]|uniref:Uncharacterized protein n=1 Tax=Chitinivorax tropicus TaxID=714531 RepID=A0A840MH09_9PROT|nr:hypothetical protein [Chitinivorax tropicus]MBB5017680.1 hypothetical protein [Chitinivorax tropicus]
MWAPSEQEPFFTPSVARELIARCYQAMNRIETYVLALLLRQLGYIEPDVARIQLPEQLAEFPVTDGHGVNFLLTASREKGIRLHFDQTISARERNEVLVGFLTLVESVQQIVSERKLAQDTADAEMPINWWYAIDQTLTAVEGNGEPVKALGKVLFE